MIALTTLVLIQSNSSYIFHTKHLTENKTVAFYIRKVIMSGGLHLLTIFDYHFKCLVVC